MQVKSGLIEHESHFFLPPQPKWLPEQLCKLMIFNNIRITQLKFHVV